MLDIYVVHKDVKLTNLTPEQRKKFEHDLEWAIRISGAIGVCGIIIAIYSMINVKLTLSNVFALGLALFAFLPQVMLLSKKAHEFGIDSGPARFFTFIVVVVGVIAAVVAVALGITIA